MHAQEQQQTEDQHRHGAPLRERWGEYRRPSRALLRLAGAWLASAACYANRAAPAAAGLPTQSALRTCTTRATAPAAKATCPAGAWAASQLSPRLRVPAGVTIDPCTA